MPKLDNIRHEKFCNLYVSREFLGNGTQAYCEAFNIDPDDPKKYHSARTKACDLLTKVDVLTRIDELLELDGLNDQSVDKRLNFLIQQNGDMRVAIEGIKEYNKLKSRIEEKKRLHIDGVEGIDITIKGSGNKNKG